MSNTPKENTLVTLYVNTGVPGLSQGNIVDHVWMADSNGDIVDNNAGHVRNYITGVLSKGNVTWIPAVINIRNDPSDYVLITDVKISSGNDNKITISKMPTSKDPNHVNGKVSGNPGGDPFEYRILFTVSHVGNDGKRKPPQHFYIDPKIQIH